MQVLPHIETSQLICYANPLTAFYMRATLEFNGLKKQMQYSRYIHMQNPSADARLILSKILS